MVDRVEDRRTGPVNPIDLQYHRILENVQRTLDEIFNGPSPEPGTRQTGFILLIFPYGDHKGRANYVSNGAAIEDAIVVLEEQAQRFKEQLVKERSGPPS